MREVGRAAATGLLWVAFTIFIFVMMALVAAVGLDGGTFMLAAAFTVAMALAVSFATARLWRAAGRESALPPERKAKRDTAERFSRLIDQLDEDEVIELETLLLAREQGTLD